MKLAGSKVFTIALFSIFVLILSGCSKKIIRSLQKGSVGIAEFHKVIDVEYDGGLLIIPVTIQEVTYRFLFDSGAPLCISEEIQQLYAYNKISSVGLTDTDGSSSKVDVVEINSISIDGIPFIDQSAFVLSMKAHPMIKCIGVDGIIGSNLMRFCNWKINIRKKQISLSNNMDQLAIENAVTLPFTTDIQYNIYLNMRIDSLNFGSFELDYGSTGYLSIFPRTMNALINNEIIDTVFKEFGYRQSGILGYKIKAESDIAYTDKIRLDDLPVDSIRLITSQYQLIGTALLKRFEVGIDWTDHVVHFTKLDSAAKTLSSHGFTIGYTHEDGFYVMSVVKGSPAFKVGIKPGMKVLEIDGIVLRNSQNYCKYIDNLSALQDSLVIKCEDSKGEMQSYKLERELPAHW
jgi:hypothetical protein